MGALTQAMASAAKAAGAEIRTSAEVIEGLVDRSDASRAMKSDIELEREMRRRMQPEPWLSTQNIRVRAEGGVLSLEGLVEGRHGLVDVPVVVD